MAFPEMKLNKRKGFDIGPMLRRMSKVRTLNPDGSMSMSGFVVLDEFESYFRTAIEIEGRTDAFVRSIVKKAMHAEQDMTESKFIEHCRRIAHTTMNDRQRVFKVLFPIWGSIGSLSGRRRWGNVSITFDISHASRFAQRAIKDRANQLEQHERRTSIAIGDFQDLPLALCSVEGIDVLDAFEQAENAISKELGLYSLTSSRGKFIFSTEPDKPINTILLAPHMTVHDPNGALSADMYWFNRWPGALTNRSRSAEEIGRIQRNVDGIRSRLKKLPWRETAEIALLRYYSAFSQCDLESSFLDGWRLLEVVGGHTAEKSETLIKRAAWFFENRDEQYQVGLHLMQRRNLISHGRPVRDESYEGLAFQMKNFLAPLLHAFLTNPFNFESIEEFWSFCDLPVDKKMRSRKAHLLRCSSKFRREE